VRFPALAFGRQGELRACEAVDEFQRASEPQLGADVPACAGIGGGRHCQARHVREYFGQPAEHAVFGAEVVAPLVDAVRLVNGHKRKRQVRQALQHRRLHQAFGRQVEQVQHPLADPPPDVAARVQAGIGVKLLRRHPRLLQGRYLVGHQRDQG
jgi:hypothetical protein